jgi:hypothetical protein
MKIPLGVISRSQPMVTCKIRMMEKSHAKGPKVPVLIAEGEQQGSRHRD